MQLLNATPKQPPIPPVSYLHYSVNSLTSLKKLVPKYVNLERTFVTMDNLLLFAVVIYFTWQFAAGYSHKDHGDSDS